ncbi:radical SAM protein [Candidatus Woesearchaeota archaeon]|nr:radical SAM protein [Candidatus Woesearchaeota archaeon]
MTIAESSSPTATISKEDLPNELIILITRKCNFGCHHCFVNKNSTEELTEEQIQKGITDFLEATEELDERIISFFGGEPLTRKENLFNLIRFIRTKSSDVTVRIVTNGKLLTVEIAKFLAANNVRMMAGVNDIDFFLSDKEIIDICNPIGNLVVTRSRLNIIEKMKPLIDAGYRKIQVSADCTYVWTTAELDEYEKNLNAFYKYYADNLYGKVNLLDLERYTHFINGRSYRECKNAFLGTDGNYTFCSGHCYNHLKAVETTGNVETGIDFMARKQQYIDTNKEIDSLRTECSSCELYDYCFCPVQNYIYDKVNKIDPQKHFNALCRITKITFAALNKLHNILKYKDMQKNAILKSMCNHISIPRLYLTTTDICNCRCDYCYVEKATNKMSLATIDKTLDLLFLTKGNHKRVLLFGGEPTLAQDELASAITMAKDKAEALGKTVQFSIATNGMFVSEKFISLVNHNSMKVCVSIDGKQDCHDKHRPTVSGKPTFQKVIAGVDRLKSRIDPKNLSCLLGVHKDFIGKMHENFLYIVDEIGIPHINIEPIDNPEWSDEDAEEFKKNIVKILNTLVERINDGKPFYLNNLNLILHEKLHPESGIDSPEKNKHMNIVAFPNADIGFSPLNYYKDPNTKITNLIEDDVVTVLNKIFDYDTSKVKTQSNIGMKLRNHFTKKFADYLIDEAADNFKFKEYINEASSRVFE